MRKVFAVLRYSSGEPKTYAFLTDFLTDARIRTEPTAGKGSNRLPGEEIVFVAVNKERTDSAVS